MLSCHLGNCPGALSGGMSQGILWGGGGAGKCLHTHYLLCPFFFSIINTYPISVSLLLINEYCVAGPYCAGNFSRKRDNFSRRMPRNSLRGNVRKNVWGLFGWKFPERNFHEQISCACRGGKTSVIRGGVANAHAWLQRTCATLVNTQTDRETEKQNSFWPVIYDSLSQLS